MALIKCPNCGNQMSDKALCCPACGYENQAQEKKIQNFCIECGNKLSENDTVCSVCGCPINKEHENLEQLQKVEVASIKIPKISKQKKNYINCVYCFTCYINNCCHSRNIFYKAAHKNNL